MFSLQCPCRMIWFEEILKGSYKVVLCPRSGEGYFGLARRTYSLQCPPDIAAVRLFRFTLRFCDEAIPNRGSRALRCRSRERPMALSQLPAHVVHKLGQHSRVIQEFLSTREYAKESRPFRSALFRACGLSNIQGTFLRFLFKYFFSFNVRLRVGMKKCLGWHFEYCVRRVPTQRSERNT